MGEVHAVVFHERHASLESRIAREVIHVLQHLLTRIVGRMRLAGEDDLYRTLHVRDELPQSLDIAEDQVGALVRGESTGEPDRERLGVE